MRRESASSNFFDVFINFHGEDTRSKFTSHLNKALQKSGLWTFIDDSELEKGDEISSALIKAIEESDASLYIHILKRLCFFKMKDHGQIVIPIFYEIDPSHVRNQIGSYKQAFAKHKQNLKHNKDKLQK
ncbi:disease resistance protein (TIR-NBS-LRR class) [Medicago truncatula]|uniref:Disease resistance protein (TIR-NBS-LRR class) n=1 Tax=Medicago truncatula TaxID=3880 RepID=G7J6M4_MEDTR|nr:disease resistance protein (TIR-NBS-LRR class) [Medicago truncatula]